MPRNDDVTRVVGGRSDIYADVCLRWGEKGFAFEATERPPGAPRNDDIVLVDLP